VAGRVKISARKVVAPSLFELCDGLSGGVEDLATFAGREDQLCSDVGEIANPFEVAEVLALRRRSDHGMLTTPAKQTVDARDLKPPCPTGQEERAREDDPSPFFRRVDDEADKPTASTTTETSTCSRSVCSSVRFRASHMGSGA
jgi:hypothetical protein